MLVASVALTLVISPKLALVVLVILPIMTAALLALAWARVYWRTAMPTNIMDIKICMM